MKTQKIIFNLFEGIVTIFFIISIFEILLFIFFTCLLFWVYLMSLPEFSHLINLVSLMLKWIRNYYIILLIGTIYFVAKYLFKLYYKKKIVGLKK